MLHGALGSAAQFEPYLPLLKDSFKLHRFNFFGHSGNPVPEKLYMTDLITQLEEYVLSNELNGSQVFGYSMGGYAALCLASRKPDLLGDILTLGTKMNWTAEGAENESRMLNPEAIMAKVPTYANYLQNLHGENWAALCKATAGLMLNLGQSPLLNKDLVAGLKNRIIYGLGDADKMVTRDETLEAVANTPGAGLLILPHTPHPLDKVSPQLLSGVIRLLL